MLNGMGSDIFDKLSEFLLYFANNLIVTCSHVGLKLIWDILVWKDEALFIFSGRLKPYKMLKPQIFKHSDFFFHDESGLNSMLNLLFGIYSGSWFWKLAAASKWILMCDLNDHYFIGHCINLGMSLFYVGSKLKWNSLMK